jgi:peptidoglycan/xylan/chitin deacetylase (PgdA/CDA1 family)
MTRFQISALLAALLALIAGLSGCGPAAGAVAVLFLGLLALGVARPQLRFFGDYLCHGPATPRQVALTFDDGPDPRSTPALLEVLRQHQVEAAFFAIGQRVESAPQLATDILRAGHLLENHSHAHSHATNFYSVRRLRADLERAQQAIVRHTGTTPRFFRPPIGLSNPNTFRVATQLRLKVIGWSIRSLDTRLTDPEKIVRRIEKRLRPGGIILLHDGNIPADRLVATVKLLLATLRQHGYEVVRLDRLLS